MSPCSCRQSLILLLLVLRVVAMVSWVLLLRMMGMVVHFCNRMRRTQQYKRA